MFCVIGPELEAGAKKIGKLAVWIEPWPFWPDCCRGCTLASWRGGCCRGYGWSSAVSHGLAIVYLYISLSGPMVGESPSSSAWWKEPFTLGSKLFCPTSRHQCHQQPERHTQLAPHHPSHRGTSLVPEYSVFPMSCLLYICPSGSGSRAPSLHLSRALFLFSPRQNKLFLPLCHPICGNIY